MSHQRWEAPDWREYKMEFGEPFRELESAAAEEAVVAEALAALVRQGLLPHGRYDAARFLAQRQEIRRQFEIPWTAISPRLHRLLYAINDIVQPQVMVAVGVFCGFTFIANAGPGVGEGAGHCPRRLVGIEIDPQHSELARRNVARLDAQGRAEILATDGVEWLASNEQPIDLLYLDATAPGAEGKTLYERLLRTALPRLRSGGLVLAHNAENLAAPLAGYLAAVRDPVCFAASVTVVLDDQGLEASRVASGG